jgi:uncharacterized membrane protein YdfJ with MMPL/SSD domain
MNFVIIIIAIIIVAAIFFMFQINKNKAEKKSINKAPIQTKEQNHNTEFKKIMDNLLQLNILIRTDADLDPEISKTIEAIIDDLKATIPLMMEKFPTETLTYELKKIGSAHLFNSVKEYTDLSEASRENQISIFKDTLASLNEISTRARNIAEKNEIREFKTMATFLKTKFQTNID